ncbi:MAG: ATP-dependent DNA helicase [Halobacteriaceae archaeon]
MDWRAVFGHDEPYDAQVDGAETTVETARAGGFTVVEGACGTGKTMLALSAGVSLVRDPDTRFERVVVLTSVKQQLRQFEEDLATINDGLPADADPVSALTLVGKADVCPYNLAGAGGIDDENVYERCEALRDRTRELADAGSPGGLAADARSQQVGIGEDAAFLSAAGEPTPYGPDMPERDDAEYCPFYAGYLEDLPDDGDPVEAVPFDWEAGGVITPDALVAGAAGAGVCPHSAMGALLGHVEVVVGNYYHAFDPTTTAAFTGELVDDSTFVVCDEAHMLEPRVRDLVSDGVADETLREAEAELSRVLRPLRYEGQDARGDEAAQLRAAVADSDVTEEALARTRDFLRDLREELDRRVTAHLDREASGWRNDPASLEDREIPLREPEEPGTDEITEWAIEAGYAAEDWTRCEVVGAAVAAILNAVVEDGEERERSAPAAGRALAAWRREDHVSFFRELELTRTWDAAEPADSWRRAYNARLSMHNCLPGDAIGDRLADFGGGILMSATLAPLDVFTRVTGLAALEERGRPVVTRTYGLNFPGENRAGYAVDAPKFTFDNRGPTPEPGAGGVDPDAAGDDESRGWAEVRRLYADAVTEVAESPGNVLVGMPSYAEAEWVAGRLDERLEKPVLLDESSGADATQTLKDEFFAGPGKVLVTSIRGTLTEGVDYRGDRLRAAVVCGVPIVNTASPRTRAVRAAYDRAFGNGFEYALVVPAVRKARQALGRVIRGPEEVGVRVLVDARWARDTWDGVREYLPEPEEYQPVTPDMLELGLGRFWAEHGEATADPEDLL